MKFNNSSKIYLLSFLVFLFFACNKTNSDNNSTDTLIPNIANADWRNISDIQHDDLYNFFQIDNPGVANSTFTGHETIDGDQHTFSGSYQNSKITFTFSDGPKQE